jgi:hypothetical protein
LSAGGPYLVVLKERVVAAAADAFAAIEPR